MKDWKNVMSLVLVAALTATLAVGAMAIEAAAAEGELETITVDVDKLLEGAMDPEYADDSLRPTLITAPENKFYSAGQYDIAVNGEKLDVQATAMVPLRKVAEALGYTVTWNGDNTVTVDSGKMHTTVTFGEDLYVATTSIPGAVGMTAPFSLGVPPYCVNGVTYVPLGLFEVLEGNVEGMFTVKDHDILIDQTADPNGEAQTRVILVSVEEKLSQEALDALMAKYKLTLVYDYQNFNMYAFSLETALDQAQTQELLKALEAEEGILSAEPDQVIRLDDPVTPQLW